MEEIVEDVPINKILFKIMKFLLGKRKTGISYKELYIFYTNTYTNKKYSEETIKNLAMEHVLEIYYYNNKRLPEYFYGKL